MLVVTLWREIGIRLCHYMDSEPLPTPNQLDPGCISDFHAMFAELLDHDGITAGLRVTMMSTIY